MEPFENGTSLNISVTEVTKTLSNETNEHNSHPELFLYYVCLAIVLIPGLITNALSLGFIVKDVHKAVFPAIVLLLALICADLAAVTFTTVHLSLLEYVTDVTYPLCAVLSVFNAFFRLYSGILNVLMCTDRVLAICAPYFYKSNIHVSTWKLGIIVAGALTGMFTLFPVIGLGDVVTTREVNGKPTLSCSTFDHRTETNKKVYGIMYGIFGLLIIIYIVIGNCMVIVTVFKMRKNIIAVNPEPSTTVDSDSGQNANKTSFEIAFAKLMGGLAIVYLLSGAPYSVSNYSSYS